MEFRDKRIERNVGDKNGRTPHFNIVGSGGVLYVPDGKSWGMRYFKTPEDAVDFLDAKFGIMGLEQTEAADKQAHADHVRETLEGR